MGRGNCRGPLLCLDDVVPVIAGFIIEGLSIFVVTFM